MGSKESVARPDRKESPVEMENAENAASKALQVCQGLMALMVRKGRRASGV